MNKEKSLCILLKFLFLFNYPWNYTDFNLLMKVQLRVVSPSPCKHSLHYLKGKKNSNVEKLQIKVIQLLNSANNDAYEGVTFLGK